MKIGFTELLVIFVVALLVIGPDKLPSYARKLGIGLREFRKASEEVTKDLRESVIEPLEEAQRPIKEAIQPLDDINKAVKGDFTAIEREFKNIGKEKPAAKPAEAAPAAEAAKPAEAAPEAEAVSAPDAE